MINDIREMLKQGKDVYLECINKEGFIGNESTNHYYKENKVILELEELKVEDTIDDYIYFFNSHYGISPDEHQYFKIKG